MKAEPLVGKVRTSNILHTSYPTLNYGYIDFKTKKHEIYVRNEGWRGDVEAWLQVSPASYITQSNLS